MKVYLGLGSNIGDRQKNLTKAIEKLGKLVKITKKSCIYETEPIGYSNQQEFLNMVIEVKTNMSPNDLLKLVKNIETGLGRQPNFKNGPRKIDIDILLYGNLKIENDELTIPHPQITRRAFVLKPLQEIAPELKLKLPDGRMIKDIKIPDQEVQLLQ